MKRRTLQFLLFLSIVASFLVVIHRFETAQKGGKKLPAGYRADEASQMEVLPYTPENSVLLYNLLRRPMKFYEYGTEWKPKPWFQSPESGKHLMKLYPFPLVENFDRKGLFKNRFDINSLPPPKKWENFGIQGAGVVASFAFDPKNVKTLFAGTEGAGLFISKNFGLNWAKLPVGRNDIRKVMINPNNSKHVVAGCWSFLFPDSIPMIYQSTNGGSVWDFGYEISILKNGFKKGVTPSDLALGADNQLTLVTIDKSQVPFAVYVAQKSTALKDDSSFLTTFAVPATDVGKLKIRKSGSGLINVIASAVIPLPGGKKKDTLLDSLYKTTDGGKNWDLVYEPENLGYPDHDITAYDISEDGERISLFLSAYYVDTDYIVTSTDGGDSWTATAIKTLNEDVYDNDHDLDLKYKYVAQDLVVNDSDEDHIAIFLYMHGLFESFDGGATFSKVITSYSGVKYLQNAEGETQAIEPVDLRLEALKYFPLPEGFAYFMPTDQGLFLFNAETGILTNMTKDLYLGDSGQVTVTSCPRVYSGLWHVGSYWVNPDNSIEGFNGGENWGYGIGPDDGCETPVFSPVHGYLYDGKKINEGKTQWFGDNIDFGWPIEETFMYHDDWWYDRRWWGGFGNLIAVNDAFTKTDTLFANNNKANDVQVYGIDLGVGKAPLWILDKNRILWTLDGNKWTLMKDFSKEPVKVKNVIDKISGIDVWSYRIVLYGQAGLVVSPDNGGSWTVRFEGKKVWAAAEDKCGSLYVAAQPDPKSNFGGVYLSKNDGKNFSKLGVGDSRSFISSLAIDHVNDVLYAGTAGESILRFALDPCDVE